MLTQWQVEHKTSSELWRNLCGMLVSESVDQTSGNTIIWAYALSCLLSFESLCLSISFSARVLRKVLHFLADIGDVCNDKLGLPYQKCTKLFDEGRENCMELLSVFSFLCHILDGFQSLCGLARGASLAYD